MLSVQPQPSQPQPFLPVRTPSPTALRPLEGLDLQARYQSARTGGDFFDALALGPHVIFLLTDIAGTRSGAHTIAACAQDTFRRRAPQLFGTPATNLSNALSTLAHDINHTLTTATPGVCFAPTFLACFDLSLGVLTYINAGGQPAIFRDADGARLLPNACMPLGLFTHLTYEPAIQAFEPGACLLLLTKGVIEARRGRTPFGTERVTNLLQSSPQTGSQRSPQTGPQTSPQTSPTTTSALDLCQAILQQAHQYTRPPWYALAKLPFTKPERVEDLTAVALVRPC